jgi:hypothetical protein
MGIRKFLGYLGEVGIARNSISRLGMRRLARNCGFLGSGSAGMSVSWSWYCFRLEDWDLGFGGPHGNSDWGCGRNVAGILCGPGKAAA